VPPGKLQGDMERMNPLWHADFVSVWIFLRQTGKAKHSEAPRLTFKSVSHLISLYDFRKVTSWNDWFNTEISTFVLEENMPHLTLSSRNAIWVTCEPSCSKTPFTSRFRLSPYSLHAKVKGIVHPKMKMLSVFTHPHVVPTP